VAFVVDGIFPEFFGLPYQQHSTMALHAHLYPVRDEQLAGWWPQFRDISRPTDMNNNTAMLNRHAQKCNPPDSS
jgi:hypothetical protein